jgi:hypothetical protein
MAGFKGSRVRGMKNPAASCEEGARYPIQLKKQDPRIRGFESIKEYDACLSFHDLIGESSGSCKLPLHQNNMGNTPLHPLFRERKNYLQLYIPLESEDPFSINHIFQSY